jgi:PIN domain nuclease of toxin-antitoxin system
VVERVLLDSSALLALLRQEPGAEQVTAVLPGAAISAVNAVEVVGKLVQWGLAPGRAAGMLRDLDLPMPPFEANAVDAAGALLGRHRGRLSLGDCACIATGRLLGLPLLTTDRAWAELDLGAEVRLIR